MKFLQKISFLFIAAMMLPSIVQARSANPAFEITAEPRPSHPHGNPPNYKIPSPRAGEDLDHPIILDQYDYLEASVPAVDLPNMQITYTNKDAANLDDRVDLPINTNEVALVYAYNLVYDRWGKPCTDEGAFNSFQLEPTPLFFQGADDGYLPFLGIFPVGKPVLAYRDDLDPACPTDEKGNPVDLQDGDILEIRYYLSLQSECLVDVSEQSPLCTAHLLKNNLAVVGILPISKEAKILAYKYSQDPKKGGQPDEVYSFEERSMPMNQQLIYKTSPDVTGAIIRFKSQ